ncbi:MAG TPA: MFS transporter [Arenibaculum sp.]|nr:MFS transporter [Arenibaculum sp.]
MIRYLSLFRDHARPLTFGLLLAFLSSFGQTFFISLSGAHVREKFGLSHGDFGAIYSIATLGSGLLMVWAGALLDRVPTGRYTAAAFSGLAVAAVAYASAPNIVVLAAAIFALRLFGQGMLSHASVTSMARRFQHDRGKAIGVATLGHPAGEAVLPSIAVAAAALLGWTTTWWTIAFLVLVVMASRPHRLLDGIGHGSVPVRPGVPTGGAAPEPVTVDYTRGDVLRDWRFYLFLPSMLGPPAIGTGFFFHQLLLAQTKDWPLPLLTTSFTGYALGSVLATVVTGSLADRFRSTTLTRFYLLPMAAGTLVLAFADGVVSAPAFFVLAGITTGATGVIVPSVLADLYGTRHIGAIRALGAAIMVLATAVTPGLMGVLVDRGIGMEVIALGCAAYLVAASLLNTALGLQRPAALRQAPQHPGD